MSPWQSPGGAASHRYEIAKEEFLPDDQTQPLVADP
jgi:hypothetical protein